jgi:hypothetical protein
VEDFPKILTLSLSPQNFWHRGHLVWEDGDDGVSPTHFPFFFFASSATMVKGKRRFQGLNTNNNKA